MEAMYQSYKDIAEIRLVYIKEAHAADSDWSVSYAVELGINQHQSYDERCTTADLLLNAKSLTIPFVVDGIKNEVGEAYHAFPDRVFLVRKDGRLAVAAERGPRGFAPALTKAHEWLEEFKLTGMEPDLAEDAQEPGKDRHVTGDKSATTTKSQPSETIEDESSARDSPDAQPLDS